MSPLTNAVARLPRWCWLLLFWCAWCAATAVMLLPASQLPTVNIWDKAEHAGTFAVLMLLAAPAYRHCTLEIIAALLVVYGATIESIQHFIPSRSFSLLDIVADSVGVIAGALLLRRIKQP